MEPTFDIDFKDTELVNIANFVEDGNLDFSMLEDKNSDTLGKENVNVLEDKNSDAVEPENDMVLEDKKSGTVVKENVKEGQKRYNKAPLSEKDLQNNIQKQVPSKTRQQNIWSLNAWKDWAEWRNNQPKVCTYGLGSFCRLFIRLSQRTFIFYFF